MRAPVDHFDAARAGTASARDAYLARLSAVLGADRAEMVASAWSGKSIPPWLQETRVEQPLARPARRGRDGLSVIRQTTMICVTAALGSCLFLYWGKSRAAMADREVGRIMRATEEAHARVYALRTEWALLNQPERLKAMTDRYLTLQPVASTQFAEMAKLPDRLQAPAATLPDGGAEAEALASDDTVHPEAANIGKAAEQPVAANIKAPTIAPAAAAERVAASAPVAMPGGDRPDAAEPGPIASPQQVEQQVDTTQHRARQYSPAKVAPVTKYLTPMIAEARQPVRVKDTGEALLNGDVEAPHLHAHTVRAAAYAPTTSIRLDESRLPHRLAPPRIDLPHWLMQTRTVHTGRSEPPHTLEAPQTTAIPLATPRPEPATVQRVVAPAPEEHPPIPQARPEADEPAPYRPRFRQSYAYGNPYRSYYGQAYGGAGYYGGYGNPYYRAYPPPPPNSYYQ